MNEFFVAGSGALQTLTYVYILNNIFEKEWKKEWAEIVRKRYEELFGVIVVDGGSYWILRFMPLVICNKSFHLFKLKKKKEWIPECLFPVLCIVWKRYSDDIFLPFITNVEPRRKHNGIELNEWMKE